MDWSKLIVSASISFGQDRGWYCKKCGQHYLDDPKGRKCEGTVRRFKEEKGRELLTELGVSINDKTDIEHELQEYADMSSMPDLNDDAYVSEPCLCQEYKIDSFTTEQTYNSGDANMWSEFSIQK